MNKAAGALLICVLLLFSLCACGEDLGQTLNDIGNTKTIPSVAYHFAFWTGSEMLIYAGETHPGGNSVPYGSNGLRYDPISDAWKLTADGGPYYETGTAPDAAAVWTGTEMIVYGYGKASPADTTRSYLGGRYNPATDTWTAISTANSPSITGGWTAVWTGSKMFVGGYESLKSKLYFSNYDPASDMWNTMTIYVTTFQMGFSAVWTGSEVIMFGGYSGPTSYFNTGGRHDPATMVSTLTSTINAPSARSNHVAVWTGTEMIVFGGNNQTTLLFDGARYNPDTDTWMPIAAYPENTTIFPVFGNRWSAIWSGTEMIVWYDGYSGFGGRYNPTTNTWTVLGRSGGTPLARAGHSAVWTGKEMIIWGGTSSGSTGASTGARYDPRKDAWTATSFIVD